MYIYTYIYIQSLFFPPPGPALPRDRAKLDWIREKATRIPSFYVEQLLAFLDIRDPVSFFSGRGKKKKYDDQSTRARLEFYRLIDRCLGTVYCAPTDNFENKYIGEDVWRSRRFVRSRKKNEEE